MTQTKISIDSLRVWGIDIPLDTLTPQQKSYLESLPIELPNVQWLWNEMNVVWRSLSLNNLVPLSAQQDAVAAFYSHPIWLVNGIFTAVDQESKGHRAALASYILKLNVDSVADYGGGFGELALILARQNPALAVSVIEPYPSSLGLHRMSEQRNLRVIDALKDDSADVIVVQDVLEHVDDPVGLACSLASHLRIGGRIVFANCFHPMIQCHLPPTFHLRYTFTRVMIKAGLQYVGRVDGVSNARVFEKSSDAINLAKARAAESWSRVLGPGLNLLADAVWSVRHRKQ